MRTLSQGLLSAKLWRPDSCDGLEASILESPVAQGPFKAAIDRAIECSHDDLPSLQRFVRTQFMCIPRVQWSTACTEFVSAYVIPALGVNVALWDANIAQHSQSIALKLTSGNLTSIQVWV